MHTLEQQVKVSSSKRTSMPKLEWPSGSTVRFAAILAALLALLLWLGQHILQAGLAVR